MHMHAGDCGIRGGQDRRQGVRAGGGFSRRPGGGDGRRHARGGRDPVVAGDGWLDGIEGKKTGGMAGTDSYKNSSE